MARFVAHSDRRQDILEKALDVFIEEGFDDTTFQKIADRADIRRTTLYQYFKDKREIFLNSIKQFMKEIEIEICRLNKDISLCSLDKLIEIMRIILQKLEDNGPLLATILDYLVNSQNSTHEIAYHIRRRTIRFRHTLNDIIIDGITRGEIRPVTIQSVNEMLFVLIEGALCELAVFKRGRVKTLLPPIEHYIRLLAA